MATDTRFAPFLKSLFDAAVAAAHPAQCLPAHLPEADGRIVLLAAGKAGGAMTEVAERHYREDRGLGPDRLTGLCVTRHGYARPTGSLELVEAGHPVPDEAGVEATRRVLDLARTAGPGDHVVVLLSGGGSANWIAPVAGVSLADKQALTKALLRSGATIDEINTVRKHLSRIKGGHLAQALGRGARLTTLAISDVPRDDPAVIASGPTVPDPTTLADARAICLARGIEPAASIRAALADPANETPKPGDAAFEPTTFRIVARPKASLEAAARVAEAAGYVAVLLGDSLEGEARDRAAEHARLAREMAGAGRRCVLLSGGELTVTIRGDGRGGPNQEYALALALALDGAPGIAALAGDTDGTDGGRGLSTDPAGALVDPGTLDRARARGLDAASFLARNDSTGFFETLSDLLVPGPTYTNVNDFRAIVVDKT
ncbi:glycerate kinase type-2 family protein [Polymorphum gilvum]|uniref:Putative hydroxypyruvate reductase Putative glycerate kinase n=1 Tax=Polymorphum gilvum (strain LMG 25793 / CGMCC 1.9160 / SL003B-26A1) TaxID=991905 RepID=F2IWJ6_POLGS|nr:glycerate kinase [Polymorphum gilvum]ADZ69295.1 Putative hydroxypyruvate reductase; Putative glycerate kinase [Polymorphum gilvum SL003B-26A1]